MLQLAIVKPRPPRPVRALPHHDGDNPHRVLHLRLGGHHLGGGRGARALPGVLMPQRRSGRGRQGGGEGQQVI